MRCKGKESISCEQARVIVFGLTINRFMFYLQCLYHRINERAKIEIFRATGNMPSDDPIKPSPKPLDKTTVPKLSKSDISSIRHHANLAVAHWEKVCNQKPSKENLRVLKNAKRKIWDDEREFAYFGEDSTAKRCACSDLLWEKWILSGKKLTGKSIDAMIAYDVARSVLYDRGDDPDDPPRQEYIDTLSPEIVDKAFSDMAKALRGANG